MFEFASLTSSCILIITFINLLAVILIKNQITKLLDNNLTGDKESFIITRLSNQVSELERNLRKEISDHRDKTFEGTLKNAQTTQEIFNSFAGNINKNQMQALETTQTTLHSMIGNLEQRVTSSVDKLSKTTEERLLQISSSVDKKLNEGFEKSTATFTDIVKRLALIDDAQKKITELSGNVVSLQEILSDKRSRGAFGEIQLAGLIRNMLPESSFALQHTLSNGNRADCALFLPEPTGTVMIDAKFPLESYQTLYDIKNTDFDREKARIQFKLDIKKHIKDIKDKYIVDGETSDGAIMFLPAEAVFAEIHAHFPDLIEESHNARVWLTSPTTMMAIITTARAVLKDDATRKQVHIIQEHLRALSKDFERFDKRMDNLAKHINQANTDVEDVKTSAKKITERFQRIDRVELQQANAAIPSIDELDQI